MNLTSIIVRLLLLCTRRRLWIAGICAGCLGAAGIFSFFGYQHFHQQDDVPKPDPLLYPVFEPIMNAREVTIDVIRIDRAREPKGTIEWAAKQFDKYIPGRVRIVEESTVTLNQPLEKRHLRSIIPKCSVQGPSVVHLIIVPYSPLGYPNLAATRDPSQLNPIPGYGIIMQANVIDQCSMKEQTKNDLAWRHTVFHELCHGLNLPADPDRRFHGSHCKDRKCVLNVFPNREEIKKGYIPTLDLCSGCAQEIREIQRKNKKPLRDFAKDYDVSTWYDEMVRMNPRHSEAYCRRADFFDNRGEYAKAIQDASEAIALDPKGPGNYTRRGHAYVGLRDIQKAIDDFSAALRIEKNHGPTWAFRGVLFASIGEHNKAITDLTQALWLEPRNSYFAFERALICRDSGDYSGALRDVERSIFFDWYNSDAMRLRGSIYLDAFHDPEKALKDLDNVIFLNPDNSDAYTYRGRACSALKKYAEASADFEKALKMEPQNPQTISAFIEFLVECPDSRFRNMDRALLLASKHLDISKWQNPETAETLAKACANKQDYMTAVQYQEKAISLVQDKAQKATMEETLFQYRSKLVR